MTLKDFFTEARTYHYDFPTVAAGLTTGVFSIIFKSFNSLYRKAGQRSVDKFRVTENGVSYYNIKGLKVSDISWHNFKDILCVFCYHDDDYRNRVVEKAGGEGPYCYVDNEIDVTLCEGDVVIDAEGVGSPTMVFTAGSTKSEEVAMVTLDDFVKENGIEKVDFIKSDIEGAERQLLRGATEVMRKFGPKLSICTYHLPDDREVLAEVIMKANPRYRIVQGPKKLYAQIKD
jgi:hypothetical protein